MPGDTSDRKIIRPTRYREVRLRAPFYEIDWPGDQSQATELLELRKNVCLTIMCNESEIFQRCSSYSKFVRIIAYCLRVRPANNYSGVLCAREVKEAEARLIALVQATRFSDEIRKIKDNQPIKQSRIANLSPFLDDQGLLRVGGRLQNSNLGISSKHPILLPNRHVMIDRIIREAHERHYHSGIQTTLYTLRQRFWIVDGKNQVRKVIRTCIRCF